MNNRYKETLNILSRRTHNCDLDRIVSELEYMYQDVIEKKIKQIIAANDKFRGSHDIDIRKILIDGLKSSAKNFDPTQFIEDDNDNEDYFLIFLRNGWKKYASLELRRLLYKISPDIYWTDEDGNVITFAEATVAEGNKELDEYYFNLADYFGIPFEEVPFWNERINCVNIKNYDILLRRGDLKQMEVLRQNTNNKTDLHKICKLSLKEKRQFWKKWGQQENIILD